MLKPVAGLFLEACMPNTADTATLNQVIESRTQCFYHRKLGGSFSTHCIGMLQVMVKQFTSFLPRDLWRNKQGVAQLHEI